MILEAFAKYLQSADPETPATAILARWFWERLSVPENSPGQTLVDKVLRHEITMEASKPSFKNALTYRIPGPGDSQPSYVFRATGSSGQKLLNSLYNYAMSYEQQKWTRWVHALKASDFKKNRT